MGKMGMLIRFAAAAVLFLVSIFMRGNSCEGCWKQERDRLLYLKAVVRYGESRFSDVIPDPEYLSSWVEGTDCCAWEGVQCDGTTGRVVNLNLVGIWAEDEAYWTLNLADFLVFEHLRILDLSGNYIQGLVANEGFENQELRRRRFSNLEVLDLSFNELDDTSVNILSSFSGFSSLKSLNFSINRLTVQSFRGLERLSSNLSNLEVLDLCDNRGLTNDILPSLRKLSSLKTLYLCGTGLDSELHIPDLASKLINLKVLDMSNNDFSQIDISSSLSGLSSLKSLILQSCKLSPRSITSLSKLYSLEFLDLAGNNLNISFRPLSPQDNGRLLWPISLEVLGLRENNFSSDILLSLNGLQRLKSLDLADNKLEGSLNITGLNALSKLEILDIGGNNIDNLVVHQGTQFLSSLKVLILDKIKIDVNMLRNLFKVFSSITTLKLEYSEFKGTIVAGDFGQLSNLQQLVLDNSHNLLNKFFKSIGALTSLKVLSLKDCSINGSLPATGWSNLEKLEEFYLNDNEFEGPLPSTFGNMTSLRVLDLYANHFAGNLAPCLSSLTSLEYLDFTWNQFQIPASFSLFSNHSHFKSIHGDGNNLILDPHPTSQSWVPKFQLHELSLSSTTQAISIPLPNFLLYQNKLTLLDLSNCNLKGEFPNWLLENNTKMSYLNLGNNTLLGHFQLPSHPIPNIQSIDVSKNAIAGQILGKNTSAILFPKLHYLNMSSNAISGSLPDAFGQMMSLITLCLSDNYLSGEIPKNLSTVDSLIRDLYLSNNNLSGTLSPLLGLRHLSNLLVDGNNLSGTFPSSFFNASELSYVDVSNNHFVGKLPRSLINSTNLVELSMSNNHLEGSIPEEFGGFMVALDLSENNLSGSIPSFVNSSLIIILLSNNKLSGLTTGMISGESLLILELSNNDITGAIEDIIGKIDNHLNILLLNGNRFRGQIPNRLCNFTDVTILDFSHNSLSGPIPNCLGQIPFNPRLHDEMAVASMSLRGLFPTWLVPNQANFTTKSRSYKYEGSIIEYMTGMDLSHNKLNGDIPPEFGNMTGIKAINLSHNSLIGHIPFTFSNLEQIESLDLSFNKLNNRIPPQLTQLTFLEVFNVANNNLSGRTPDRKGQFMTFDESSYEGNPFLCGPPLQKSCADYIGQPSPNASGTAVEGDTDGGFMDMDVFCISMAVSYTMVLLVIAAVLYINPYWRQAWFYYIELVITTCYYFVIDHFPKLY